MENKIEWLVKNKNPKNLENTFLKNRHINPDSPQAIRQLTVPSFLPINRSEFLNQSHFDDKLTSVLEDGSDIVVVEDKDADGKLAGEILRKGLSDIAGQVNSKTKVHVAKTYRASGYGEISSSDILSKYPKAKFLIMSDMGITAVDEVAQAKADGFHVAILDHHLPRPDNQLPDAIVVDPNQKADTFSDKNIPASVIAHKILFDYCSENSLSTVVINKLLPLAGTALVSDEMNLAGENGLKDAPLQIGRKYIRETLKRLNQQGRPNVSPAFATLFSALEDSKNGGVNAGKNHVWTEQDLAMTISPILNAASRMDDGEKSLVPFTAVSENELRNRLFRGEGDDTSEIIVPTGSRVADLPDLLLGSEIVSTNLNSLYAKELIEVNKQRKILSAKVHDSMLKMDFDNDSKIVVIRNDETPAGIIGSAAGGIQNASRKPTFYFTKDHGKLQASARGAGVKKIHDTANALFNEIYGRDLFTGGGHAMAIGTSAALSDADKIVPFLKKASESLSLEEDPEVNDVVASTLSVDDVDSLNKFAPFGEGFQPLSIVLDGTVIKNVRVLKKNTIKVTTESGIDIMFFNQDPETVSAMPFKAGSRIWVRGPVGINEFVGRRSLQMTPKEGDWSLSKVKIIEDTPDHDQNIDISR